MGVVGVVVGSRGALHVEGVGGDEGGNELVSGTQLSSSWCGGASRSAAVVVWLSLERPREAMMLSLSRVCVCVWRAVARAPHVGSVSHRVALRSAVVQGVAKGLVCEGTGQGTREGTGGEGTGEGSGERRQQLLQAGTQRPPPPPYAQR